MNNDDNVMRLRNAANVLVKFFDAAIVLAEKYKTDGERYKTEYEAMIDKINPTVEPYSDVHNVLACEMGVL